MFEYKAPDSSAYRRLALEDSVHLGVLLCAHHLKEACRCHEQVPGRKPSTGVKTNMRGGTCGVIDKADTNPSHLTAVRGHCK